MSRPSAPPPWLVVLIYLAGTVLLGAFLAPWIFQLGKGYAAWCARSGHENTFLLGSLSREAVKADFPRYFNRSILLAAILLFAAAKRLLNVRRAELPGLIPRSGDLVQAGSGFLTAALPLLAMGLLLGWLGVFRIDPKTPWPSTLAPAALAAVSVSLLEEWLFRGALTTVVSRTLAPKAVLVFIALLFASLHFLVPPEDWSPPAEGIGPLTGFSLAGVILARPATPGFYTAAFPTLIAVAFLLGWARLATGRLWLGIGLHAGWVFALKAFSAATRRLPLRKHGVPEWLIGDDLRSGLLPLAFLGLTSLVIWWWLRRQAPVNDE